MPNYYAADFFLPVLRAFGSFVPFGSFVAFRSFVAFVPFVSFPSREARSRAIRSTTSACFGP
jgi:hypothetical protein